VALDAVLGMLSTALTALFGIPHLKFCGLCLIWPIFVLYQQFAEMLAEMLSALRLPHFQHESAE